MDLVLTRGREGFKNPKNLADVICKCPLKGRTEEWLERDRNGNLALLIVLMASFAGGVIDRAGCNNNPLRSMDCKQEQQTIQNHRDTSEELLNETSEGLFIFQLILP